LKSHLLTNAELGELLARQAENVLPPLTRAFRRASRSALLWEQEAHSLHEQGRALIELQGIGPYETKEGGERTGTFALFDIQTRRTLPDLLPRGYLRGFAFAPDGKSFYYVHESLERNRSFYRAAAYRHFLGAPFADDREIFCAGEEENLRLGLICDTSRLGFLVYRFLDRTHTDFYLTTFDSQDPPLRLFAGAEFSFGPRLIAGRLLAITDRAAPNLRIVELRTCESPEMKWIDVVPEQDSRIHEWMVTRNRILVSYIRKSAICISIFDFNGHKKGEYPPSSNASTVHFIAASPDQDEVIVESDSFTDPPAILRYSVPTGRLMLWAKKEIPFDGQRYGQTQVWYSSKDGTRIPMYLMGRRDVLAGGCHAAIMTSYGGYGVSMTPRFSVFVAFLVEQGCLFALPNIRGGSEFGAKWHAAAKRRHRQTAYDDFLAAAEWLIATSGPPPANLPSSEVRIRDCSWAPLSPNGLNCFARPSAWCPSSICFATICSTTRTFGATSLELRTIRRTSRLSPPTRLITRFARAPPIPPYFWCPAIWIKTAIRCMPGR
jgi:prolyl oligopeptidase